MKQSQQNHQVKDKLDDFWQYLTEGWHHIQHVASAAITHFHAGEIHANDSHNALTSSAADIGVGWSLMPIDMHEDKDHLIINMEIPGLNKNDIHLEYEHHQLHIRGEKKSSRESESGNSYLIERAFGCFERSIALPLNVDAEKAKARYKNGVLSVKMPKKEGITPITQHDIH